MVLYYADACRTDHGKALLLFILNGLLIILIVNFLLVGCHPEEPAPQTERAFGYTDQMGVRLVDGLDGGAVGVNLSHRKCGGVQLHETVVKIGLLPGPFADKEAAAGDAAGC